MFNQTLVQHSPHSDYVYLLEAISMLLGAQRERKADLLEEPTCTWGPSTTSSGHAQLSELTPKARAALLEIFRRHSHKGGMDIHTMTHYMEGCGVKSHRDSDMVLKGVLGKYQCLPGRNNACLSEEGFLKYYRDTAVAEPRQVWNDLYHQGYRSDLSVGQGYGDEIYDLSLSSRGDRALLPDLTVIALRSLDFYLCAMQQGPTGADVSTLILCRFCLDRPEESLHIINSALYEFANIRAVWPTDERLEKALTDVLVHILRLRDAHQTDRIQKAYCEPSIGLSNATASALDAVAQQRQYHYVQQAEAQANRYLKLWKVINKVPAVRPWLEEHPDVWQRWQSRYDNTFNSRARGGEQCSRRQHDLDSGDESDYSGRGEPVEVRGAGTRDANGTYMPCGEWDDTTMYKHQSRKGAGRAFTLYRCTLKDRTKMWYISIVPPRKTPGSNNDIDYYFSPCPSNGLASDEPPVTGWVLASPSPKREPFLMSPPPTVHRQSSPMDTDEEDLEEDNNQMLPADDSAMDNAINIPIERRVSGGSQDRDGGLDTGDIDVDLDMDNEV
ncbi:unnamed protein product [Choristocarpus tenellus]